jgi:phage terminase small subunit
VTVPILTDKQQAFVNEYLLDLNATQAAIRAGYSPATAQQMGSENLSKPVVADAIAAAMEARARRTGIDADWLLVRLAAEAQADLADLFGDGGNLKPVKDWPPIWRQGLVAGVDVVRKPGDDEPVIIDKVKLSDRIKRLELIGRHIDVQAFLDRVAVEGVDRAAEIERFFNRKCG